MRYVEQQARASQSGFGFLQFGNIERRHVEAARFQSRMGARKRGRKDHGAPDQQQQIYSVATQKLAQAAHADGGLVNRAEASTRTTLQGLLRPLGFTDVTVQFDR